MHPRSRPQKRTITEPPRAFLPPTNLPMSAGVIVNARRNLRARTKVRLLFLLRCHTLLP